MCMISYYCFYCSYLISYIKLSMFNEVHVKVFNPGFNLTFISSNKGTSKFLTTGVTCFYRLSYTSLIPNNF